MKKEMISEQALNNWIELSDKLNALIKKLVKKLLKYSIRLIGILIGYSIMSWIFLNIYDSIGFEKTLIILLIGVLWYGIRQPIPKKVKEGKNG